MDGKELKYSGKKSMAKTRNQAEFVKWFGPLLDALRDLGDSGKPKEVSNKIATNLNLSDNILDENLNSGVNKFRFNSKKVGEK